MIKCNVKHLNAMNNVTFVMNGGHRVPQLERTKSSRELPLKTNIVHEDKWEEKYSKSNDKKHYSCMFDVIMTVMDFNKSNILLGILNSMHLNM